ncbi:MAG: phosphate ABC transporter permease PstA [Betaproteobacteria bacterium]|nr:phosphate ABC transporter permease PstA [Betaproteobacteria bacterium]
MALFLTENCPVWLRRPLGTAVELLAAVPSIIYGMFGLFVFAPLFAEYGQPALQSTLGQMPVIGSLFGGAMNGIGILAAGLILAFMILPFIAAVMRDVFEIVPPILRESAYGIGCTTWEVVRHVVLPYTQKGVIGGVMLGLGRALGILFKNGIAALDWAMFTQSTPAPGSEGGGLANAIVGSLLIVGFSTVISTPVGILAGIYLAEYGDESSTASITRFVTDIMLSAPSIILGLFIYAILVAQVKHFSGWAGSLALSLIAIPVVVRTTENMLRLVPGSLREAAFALGAPRWKVATMVTLRAAQAGVVTGVLLALARISGETAPLLFTALNNQFFSSDMNKPMSNLPVVIFQFAMSPYDNWVRLAWGGALLITLTVLVLNIVARTVFSDKVSS